ncbi:MAG: hypothetical protein RL677_373 [Actinomycetota bacterium]|jgi:uncharacterized membrane protein YfcA
MMLLEGILLGIAIGAVLAIVGAGGAILAVPGLIAVMGLGATAATTSSLVIVGAAAIAGVIPRIKKQQVNIKLGIIFSSLGVVGTYLGTLLVAEVSETITVSIFAVLMFAAAFSMWRGQVSESEVLKKPNWLLVILVASVIGLITGFLGIGGGFLIVPALVLILKIPTKIAVGTSLVAIATNTVIALGFRFEFWSLIPVESIAAFTLAAVLASLLLAPLATKLPNKTVQKIFSIIVVLIAIYMLAGLT